VKTFVVRLQNNKQILGLGLSSADLDDLKAGKQVVGDLAGTGSGIWYTTEDGREFCQSRNSHVLLMLGDSPEDIGKNLGVQMPDLNGV
jgi:hypothetical protein